MSLKRYAAKRDKTEAEVISALLASGCTVQQISIKGVPDLLCGYVDTETGLPTNALLEVKSEKGKLTSDQETWISAWKGQVYVVRSAEEALEAIGR